MPAHDPSPLTFSSWLIANVGSAVTAAAIFLPLGAVITVLISDQDEVNDVVVSAAIMTVFAIVAACAVAAVRVHLARVGDRLDGEEPWYRLLLGQGATGVILAMVIPALVLWGQAVPLLRETGERVVALHGEVSGPTYATSEKGLLSSSGKHQSTTLELDLHRAAPDTTRTPRLEVTFGDPRCLGEDFCLPPMTCSTAKSWLWSHDPMRVTLACSEFVPGDELKDLPDGLVTAQ